MKESASHKRYMEKYNRRKWRAKIEGSPGTLAQPASPNTFDWVGFYTDLYERLGLIQYLPTLLAELEHG